MEACAAWDLWHRQECLCYWKGNGENEAAMIAKHLRVGAERGLGHRPFGSQGKQECLCYWTATAKVSIDHLSNLPASQ